MATCGSIYGVTTDCYSVVRSKRRKQRIFTYENRLFRGCAPGVTRTPDPRIRNPLLCPAELRAQDEHRHIPRFATNQSRRGVSHDRETLRGTAVAIFTLHW